MDIAYPYLESAKRKRPHLVRDAVAGHEERRYLGTENQALAAAENS